MEASNPAKRPYTYTTARSFRSKIPRIGNELGLGWYDYGARMLNPTIGRWNGVDALAEDPNQIDKSPYAYAWNNPTNLTDPDGNCPFCPAIPLVIKGIEAAIVLTTAYFVYDQKEEIAESTERIIDDVGDAFKPAPDEGSDGDPKPVVPPDGGVVEDDGLMVFIDGSLYPEAATHLQDAIDNGYNNTGVIDRKGRNARRAKNLRGIDTQPGKQRDEAPPVVIDNGGSYSVRHIDPSDNMGAGASVGKQIAGHKDGTKVIIVPINVPKPEDED